jgi:hypothetical protein
MSPLSLSQYSARTPNLSLLLPSTPMAIVVPNSWFYRFKEQDMNFTMAFTHHASRQGQFPQSYTGQACWTWYRVHQHMEECRAKETSIRERHNVSPSFNFSWHTSVSSSRLSMRIEFLSSSHSSWVMKISWYVAWLPRMMCVCCITKPRGGDTEPNREIFSITRCLVECLY